MLDQPSAASASSTFPHECHRPTSSIRLGRNPFDAACGRPATGSSFGLPDELNCRVVHSQALHLGWYSRMLSLRRTTSIDRNYLGCACLAAKNHHRCAASPLFNDREELKLLELADGECRNNISIWYAGGDRPENDVHYKIVDGGRLVHLSAHAHGASERSYVLRKAEPWWAARTRRRISRPYLEHFEHSLPAAERRA